MIEPTVHPGITVYTMPACPACSQVLKLLNSRKVKVDRVLDIFDDPGAGEMVLALGAMQAPVTVLGDAKGTLLRAVTGYHYDALLDLIKVRNG